MINGSSILATNRVFRVTYLQAELAVHAYLHPSINLFTSCVRASSPAADWRREEAAISKLSTAVLTMARPTSVAVWAFLYSWKSNGIKESTWPCF